MAVYRGEYDLFRCIFTVIVSKDILIFYKEESYVIINEYSLAIQYKMIELL